MVLRKFAYIAGLVFIAALLEVSLIYFGKYRNVGFKLSLKPEFDLF